MKLLRFILFMLPLLSNGQGRINGWRSHISFRNVLQVAETPGFMVAACPGGLLYANRNGTVSHSRTKVEGLSDSDISATAYSATTDILLVGYRNGNLDLLQSGKVINVPAISMRGDLPEKSINRIVCEGSHAFLCCSFGIVQVDLLRKEISESWLLGPSGRAPATYDLASFQGKWWAATSRGIMSAAGQGINLQDYRNWEVQATLPLTDAPFTSLARVGGYLYTHDGQNDRLLAFDGTTWEQKYQGIRNIRSIRAGGNGLLIIGDGTVWVAGENGSSLIQSYSTTEYGATDPRDALIDSKGELWIGDYRYGLTRKSGGIFQHIIPNSPVGDRITALKLSPEGMVVANESTPANGLPEISYSLWNSGVWQNFTGNDDEGLKSKHFITSFAFNNDKPGEYWASTAGSGLLHFQNSRLKVSYDAHNSRLGAHNGICVLRGIDLDKNGNLWYTNPTGTSRIGFRSASGVFTELPYPGMDISGLPTGDIITDSRGIHWAVLPDEGLFAFKVNGQPENLSDDLYRKIQVQSLFKNTTTSRITTFGEISSVVEDRNHQLWVGTGNGVVVYSNPEKVFDKGEYYGSQPSYENRESLFRPILEKEKITGIAVDGANRKWIGTANSGLYLFSENGTKLLQHFESHNSSLFSDEIRFLAIVPESGEIFIATGKGLLTYKSDATEASVNMDKIYVWPNPLRETYEGGVTVDGLTEGTDVRITDVSGNLVFHTRSAGGRVVWSARKPNGQRVSTGVYLVFCNPTGSGDSKIIKLLVIR